MNRNKKITSREEQVIGNIKSQFIKKTHGAQNRVGISPSTANGNISLAYYRGLAEGRKQMLDSVIYHLKKKFPEAMKEIKKNIKP